MTDRTAERWCDIADHLDHGTDVWILDDPDNLTWRRTGTGTLRSVGGPIRVWLPEPEDEVRITTPPIPEPPDLARIEFIHGSDVYGAWRDDEDSVKTGWRADQGWCLYGESVPCSWAVMWLRFGESLRGAVRLEVAK